jgi:hypothetical protein
VKYGDNHDVETRSLKKEKEEEMEKEEEHVLITSFRLVCCYSAGRSEEGNKH